MKTFQSYFFSVMIGIVIILVIGACKPTEQPGLTPEQAAAARRTIVAWLECEECTNSELDAVVKLGENAVASLSATLQQGPAPANREQLRRHLTVTYRDLKNYEITHPEAKVEMSETEYLNTYLENYVALYQSRAAEALGAIGTTAAKRALEEALQKSLRDDVKTAVSAALGRIK